MLLAALETAAFGLVLAAALFVPAGRFSWPMAWAVLGFYVAFSALSLAILPADLIAERSRLSSDARPVDLLVGGLAAVLLLPATLVVCGLDARWDGSPTVPGRIQGLAFTLFSLGYVFALWAARSNPFFSTVVRIQRERGHHVVSSGPYAWVRHPGYAGPMIGHLALPIALGSLFGLVPAVCGCALLALRTLYEDRTLDRELPGYHEYTLRVPWRLVPRVW
jgi:protein-S-isoprenylcysteine O-methyltransferase Ste14